MQTAAHARALVLVCSVCLPGCGETAQSPISQGGQGAYEASLAALSDGFVVGWHDTRDEMPEIYARLLDADGRPSSREWRLTDNPHRSYEPDVAVVPDGFAVAWYEVTDIGSAVRVGVWSDDGTLRWEQTVSAAGGKGPADIAELIELFARTFPDDGKEAIRVFLVTTFGATVKKGGVSMRPEDSSVALAELTALAADVTSGERGLRDALETGKKARTNEQ